MDAVECKVRWWYNARLVATTSEQTTLDEALGRVRALFGSVVDGSKTEACRQIHWLPIDVSEAAIIGELRGD